jgi:DNA-directed RNA polymerase specialized sigma24 family protein
MPRIWEDATDAELLAACHAQEEPFAVFYRRHERLVAGWLMRRCGRPELAADLLAEVFAAAYVAAPRFRPGPQPAQAWLLGIARHKPAGEPGCRHLRCSCCWAQRRSRSPPAG